MKNKSISKIQKVSIFYNPDISGVASLVQNIQNDYASKFDKLESVPLIINKENKLINENEKKLIASDLIICVGGDGTVLRLAQSIVNKSIPIYPYVDAAKKAKEVGIVINAGHDLSLENLAYFSKNIPDLFEVSIGHALICESLYLGFENIIPMYLERLKN